MFKVRALVCASCVMLVSLCIPICAFATQTVTNLSDSGAGSLRAALAAAAAGETVAFAPGVSGSIPLASVLTIPQSVVIQGPGAGVVTLDGQSTVQVINVTGGTVTLSGLTIANGQTAGLGGGINVGAGASASVTDSVFSNNHAGNGGAIAINASGNLLVDSTTFTNNVTTGVGGGAILDSGSAAIHNSSFIGNTAPINGGAINVQPAGTLTVIDSTFSANTSASLGGAMSNLGTTDIESVTFSANHGSSGSVIATGNANVTINNSVMADNIADSTPGALNPAPFGGTASNNVFFNNTAAGTADDQTGYGTANFVAAASEPLQALGNNGGPTQTMLPVASGPATCAGSAALLPAGVTLDQRGQPRVSTIGLTTCLDAGSVQGSQTLNALAAEPVPTLSQWALCLLAGLLMLLAFRRSRGGTR